MKGEKSAILNLIWPRVFFYRFLLYGRSTRDIAVKQRYNSSPRHGEDCKINKIRKKQIGKGGWGVSAIRNKFCQIPNSGQKKKYFKLKINTNYCIY